MRLLLGIVIGCLLTIGVAYVHDAAQPVGPSAVAEAATPGADGRMVNWDVVNRNVHGVNGWVRTQWAWISGHLNKAG